MRTTKLLSTLLSTFPRPRNGASPAVWSAGAAAVFALACLLVLLGSLPSSLEAQGTPEEGIFFDSVDVNVVNVEVFVTDRQGNPVTGLNKEDFLLLEDGEAVPISNFLAVEGGQPTDLPAAQAGSAQGSSEVLRRQMEALPQDQRLHVIVFLDNLNLHPAHRNSVIGHLRRFLRESLTPLDRIMLVSYNGSLKIEQEFTSLPELVQPVLEHMEKTATRGFEVEAQRRYLFREIQDLSLGQVQSGSDLGVAEAQSLLARIRDHARETQQRTRTTLATLQQLTDSLAGLPGRKALLYVSDGLPLRPGEALLRAWQEKFGGALSGSAGNFDFMDFDATADYVELTARASSNRVVIYTIDADSQRGFSSVSAEEGGFDPTAMSQASGGRALTTEVNQQLSASYRGALQLLSENTAGLSFINTPGLGNTLQHLADDFQTYYSLGYSPARPAADGRFHRLKVKLTEGDYQVRHRSGFRDKTPQQEMGERTLSALLLNVSDNPLAISIERGPDEDGGKRKQRLVPLLVKIPIKSLALIPGETTHQGKVSVFVAVADEDGGRSTVAERSLPVQVPADQINAALGQFIGHELKLRMRTGFHRLAIGVRDDIAGISSTVRFNVRVGI